MLLLLAGELTTQLLPLYSERGFSIVQLSDDAWDRRPVGYLAEAVSDSYAGNVVLDGTPWLRLAGSRLEEVNWYFGRYVQAVGATAGVGPGERSIFGGWGCRYDGHGEEDFVEHTVTWLRGIRRPVMPSKFVGNRSADVMYLTSDTGRAVPFGTTKYFHRFRGKRYEQLGFATTDVPVHVILGARKLVTATEAAASWARLYAPNLPLEHLNDE